jgi:hypothetical protein
MAQQNHHTDDPATSPFDPPPIITSNTLASAVPPDLLARILQGVNSQSVRGTTSVTPPAGPATVIPEVPHLSEEYYVDPEEEEV